jgi:predicted ATPase
MNNPAQIKRFIFTGIPGSGNTFVVKELEILDYSLVTTLKKNVVIYLAHFVTIILIMRSLQQKFGCFFQ